MIRKLVGNVGPEGGEILVTGASGGVGSIAVAILARLGYRVIASTGKLEVCYDLRANAVRGR